MPPDHPGTCLIREQGIRVNDGATWDMPGCMGAACYGTGVDMSIEYYTYVHSVYSADLIIDAWVPWKMLYQLWVLECYRLTVIPHTYCSHQVRGNCRVTALLYFSRHGEALPRLLRRNLLPTAESSCRTQCSPTLTRHIYTLSLYYLSSVIEVLR